MGNTKKVLYVASTFGHLASFHRPYLRWFSEQGCEVHAAAGGMYAELEGVSRHIPLPFEKHMFSLKNLSAARQLRHLIRAERYDLISLHTSLAAFFARLAVMGMSGRPVVMNTTHGYLFDDYTPFVKRQILLSAERLTAPVTDWLLTMNRQDEDIAQRYALGRKICATHGMGVDTAYFTPPDAMQKAYARRKLGLQESDMVLVYAAEFSGRKNQSMLIKTMAALPENTVLLLLGRGEKLEECQDLAKKWGLSSRVRFPGFVQDILIYYQAADVCVSSSRSEGLPLNVMEAMACGLPVVASHVKGHEDLVIPDVTGVLYPFGDAVALANAVCRLVDPLCRKRMGTAARHAIQLFDIRPVFDELTALYRESIGIAGESNRSK